MSNNGQLLLLPLLFLFGGSTINKVKLVLCNGGVHHKLITMLLWYVAFFLFWWTLYKQWTNGAVEFLLKTTDDLNQIHNVCVYLATELGLGVEFNDHHCNRWRCEPRTVNWDQCWKGCSGELTIRTTIALKRYQLVAGKKPVSSSRKPAHWTNTNT